MALEPWDMLCEERVESLIERDMERVLMALRLSVRLFLLSLSFLVWDPILRFELFLLSLGSWELTAFLSY